MESEVFKMAATQGLWAVLFVALLFYVLQEGRRREEASEKREVKYQEIIADLGDNLGIIKDIQDDVKEIKTKIYS